MNTHDLVQPLSEAVLEAGTRILDIRERGFETERKADASPVTIADLASEEVLLAALERAAPGVVVISEERAAREGAPSVADLFFLVDPLDGTKEFIAGRDEFTVNVALVAEGRPVLGIVGAPALASLYIGEPGRGADRFHDGREAQALTPRPWPVGDPPRAMASRSHADEKTKALLEKLDADAVSAGSSLKFCRLAEGGADLYPRFGPTMAWDTAAGHAVLEAAGGRVAHLDGRPFHYPAEPTDGWRNPGFLALADADPAALDRVLAAM